MKSMQTSQVKYVSTRVLKEVTVLNIREGLIPTILGTAVTTGAYALKGQRNRNNQMMADTLIGFGLAHVVLGAIDLLEHRR